VAGQILASTLSCCAGGPGMVQEDETFSGDLRAEDDPDWLANGALIELFGLTSEKALYLNGQTAEVVGFDDQHRRYRVKLHEDSAVKVVAKKNMRRLVISESESDSESEPKGANENQESFSKALVLGPEPVPNNPPLPLEVNAPTARVELVPSKQTVQRALAKVVHDTNVLQQQCLLRQNGIDGSNMSDTFISLNTAMDTYLEVVEMYQTAYSMDEELQASSSTAVQNAEDCMEVYQKIRTWAEMGIDEINLTKYSIRKHGLLKSLKNEFVEVGRDVAQAGGDAATMVRSGAATVPGVVRQATSTLGEVAQPTITAVAQVSTNAINHRHQQAQAALHNQLVGPIKRTWHLLVYGVFMCYILPLFALRAYAPLNSVVANVGLVYTVLCLCCSPCRVSGRRAKAGLLVLWPLFMVVFPLALHYWLLHPEMFSREGGSQLGNHQKLFDRWLTPPQPRQPEESTDLPKSVEAAKSGEEQPPKTAAAAKSGEERGSKAAVKDGGSVAWVKPLDLHVRNHQNSGFARRRAVAWLRTPAKVLLHNPSKTRRAHGVLRGKMSSHSQSATAGSHTEI